MSASREAFEKWYSERFSDNFISIEVQLERRGEDYIDFHAHDNWETWQEQQKRIDELQAKFEDALFDMNQRKLELCESCDGYKDPVGVCQSEGLEMAINILKQALKGGEV